MGGISGRVPACAGKGSVGKSEASPALPRSLPARFGLVQDCV